MEIVGGIAQTEKSAFIRAARGETARHVPVWFMRQAGRSLPEYLAVREGIAMLDSCRRPELIVEITLQPVRRYGVDAAIVYSDIMVPLLAIGVDLDIVPNVGPVIAQPVRTSADLAPLRELVPADVPYVTSAVRDLATVLGETPLIGFAGAPFTLASYLVEGGPSKDHALTKALMHGEPELWHALMGRLAKISAAFLRVQISAGASAVQLFDSWSGTLAPADYAEFVAPYTKAVFAAVADLDVPKIHFGVGTGELLGLMAATGPDVMGIDWRVPLHEAALRIGGRPVQGNLDPAILLAPWPVVEEQARRVLASGRRAPAHIFNLGHGVLPQTDPDQLARLVEYVHAWTP